MSYDNAKACAVVETTDVGSNLIESTPHRIQPEVILPNQPSEESHFGGIHFFIVDLFPFRKCIVGQKI